MQVTAGDLELRNGGQISSDTFGSGNAGTVTVQADRLLISGDGTAEGSSFTGIASAAYGSTGAAGTVQVTAGDLEVRNGGQISSSTFGSGDAGTVTSGPTACSSPATARRTSPASPAKPSAARPARRARAGHRRELELRNGGEISSSTFGSGDAGTVTVRPTAC